MSERDNWFWKARPRNDASFEAMMRSLDAHLTAQDLAPFQRSLHAARLVSMRLGFSGHPLFPTDSAPGAEPFGPADTLARVHVWYASIYGAQNVTSMAHGYVVVRLRGVFWRIRVGMVIGRCHFFIDRDLANRGETLGVRKAASCNVLTQVEHLTLALAQQLSEAELLAVGRAFSLGVAAIPWLDAQRDSAMAIQAAADYRHAADALVSGEYAKVRWECQQTIEKSLKGVLARHGVRYATKGQSGHDLHALAALLATHAGVALSRRDLDRTACPASVRYGETPTTRDDAFTVYQATLRMLRTLSERVARAPSPGASG